jgi:hypothetical protein
MGTFRYGIGGIVLEANLAFPELPPASGTAPALTFERLAPEGPRSEPARWVHRWSLPGAEGNDWALFARIEGEWLIRFPSQGDFRVSSDGRRIRCHPLPGIPDTTIRHLLLDQVLPLALSHQGRFALHASAVALGSIAVGFAAQSGSGKSTLAASLAGHGAEMLSDDCLMAEEEGGEWRVLPYYAGVRLWPDNVQALGMGGSPATEVAHYTAKLRLGEEAGLPFRRTPTALQALFFLSEDGADISIRPLSPREAFVALVEASFTLGVHDAPVLQRQFETIGRIVDAVPCHILCYPYSYDVLPRVREALFDCLGMGHPTGTRCSTAKPS